MSGIGHRLLLAALAAGSLSVVASGPMLARGMPLRIGGGQPETARPVLTPLAHVEVQGKGPIPVVLIPGLACDWTVYRSFMERNKDRYTMYAVTLPGFGGSQSPAVTPDRTDGAWLANAERAVAALIAERTLDRPLIIGHSMGAHLALRLAALGPEKIRGCIALDGMPAFPLSGSGEPTPIDQRRKYAGMMADQMLAAPADQWVAQQKQWFGSMVKDRTRAAELGEMSVAPARETTVRYLAELMAADATSEVKQAKVPILLIAAITDEDSPQVPKQQLRDFWKALGASFPNAQLVVFEDTRHFVMDDAPAELDRSVEQFVGGKPVDGKPLQAKPGSPK